VSSTTAPYRVQGVSDKLAGAASAEATRDWPGRTGGAAGIRDSDPALGAGSDAGRAARRWFGASRSFRADQLVSRVAA
jgi:hypothetical protein